MILVAVGSPQELQEYKRPICQESNIAYGTNETKRPIHPNKLDDQSIGGAVGATVGATAAVAAIGAIEGASLCTAAVGLPVMIAGVAIGGIVGALAGNKAVSLVNPPTEDPYWQDSYWRHKYMHCAYFDSVTPYDSYAPAYRYGIDAYYANAGRKFDEIESQLGIGWDNARGTSRLTWDLATHATRDAYERLYLLHKEWY